MKRSILKFMAIMIIPLGITLMQGCYPDNNLTYEETDIVITVYNDSVDFNKLSTYYMPDTVFVLGDEDDDEKEPIENQEFILEAMETNLNNFGYTRIYDEEDGIPDVIVSIGAFTSTTVSVGWWYPYYPGYWWKSGERDTDYWYPWYPGYYPPGYWPSYPYYTSYTTGTIIFDMYNPQDYDIIEGDTLATVYWNGGIQGVLSGGSSDSRIEKGINQAFLQSPQIKIAN